MTTTEQIATTQIHGGVQTPVAQNAVAPAIYQTAAYEFASTAHARAVFALEEPGNLYSRNANPTVAVLERRIAALEGGVAAVATASGQSAVAVALLTLVRAGGHVVAARRLYGGTVDLLTDGFTDFGIDVTFVEQDDLDAWRDAVRPETRAFFAETIGNPLADVLQVREVADIAHAAGVPLVVDATLATPALQRAGDHGADVVVHSATKFLGGHGTSLAGVLVDIGSFDFGADPARWPQFTGPYPRFGGIVLWDRFGRGAGGNGSAYTVLARTKWVHDLGPSLAPWNAFQILQGVETLELRVLRQAASALRIAEVLAEHPAVARVHHPGLAGSPGHDAARRYLPRGAGAVFSFDLAAGPDAVAPVVDALERFALVANIGDVRSLVIPPASTTHGHLSPEQLAAAGLSHATIRLSVGLEDPDDLVADLVQALDAAH
ncbi:MULTISPECIES: O-acetylhomoserine aminocarboxypropyltransferase/cysteine synthase family protein [unclassified Curtobacterium]|uniref:O-acetylhomoserine aminocarboxypropyltransferase/cysteine synthase family protein n=1 Tax=unclassified Curtobacterium TaxID=257496 RepID=UPI000DA85AC8|nr:MULTISPECIES: O-acetylhomoserine aminocarboxypropyltransferase/cysteine synthase family protein [unclassified Curtobacterium]PZE78488.1 O-acetylhomoserine aminocarboxypropyltransferase [Curtobacterium sp. MCBD17_019]WIE55340.1 O-acetylhomoserine aminocarboxypropyltransferase/cysteine synthase [Curtobacterium sp. MCBD17_003]